MPAGTKRRTMRGALWSMINRLHTSKYDDRLVQLFAGSTMEISKQANIGQLLAEDGNAARVGTIALRYGLEDKPSAIEAMLYGAQHVLIMFSAMVASPLVIGQLLNLPPELRAALITGVMLGCGIGTLISSLGVGWVGARLPLLLYAYTVYIVPVVQIAKTESLGAATGALLIGAIALLVISPIVGKVRALFPPIVVGSLLIVTGLALIKIAMNVAFGANTPYFGQPITVVFLLASIILITIIAALGNRVVRSFSVLIALVGVYIAGFFSGLDNFTNLVAAPWFRVPSLLPYGISWPSVGGLTSIIIYQVVAAIYTMSITIALCVMIQVEPTERRIRGAIAGDGLGSMIAVIFGGVPLISYDQNVGAISLTGVASRYVVAISGLILVCVAFLPKVGAAVGVIQPFMLGGTLVFMFGMIVVVGIRIVSQSLEEQRDTLIAAASVGLSTVVNLAPAQVFEVFPAAIRILAADGIVVGIVVAVLLNMILPSEKRVQNEAKS
jgi:uric acid transporter